MPTKRKKPSSEFNVVAREYLATPVKSPSSAPKVKDSHGLYPLIGCIFCWLVGSTLTGWFSWVLIGLSLLLGALFIWAIFPEELKKEIKNWFDF